MRLGWLAVWLWLPGCGTVGLEPYLDSGDAGLSDAIEITPSGPVSFGNVSAYADPPSTTLTITVIGDSSVVVNDIGLSDTSSRAFGVDVADSLFPLRLQTGTDFDFDVYFPSENYQDRNQTGAFNGAVAVTFQVSRDGDDVVVSKTLTGNLCSDPDQDGTCGI